MRRESFFRESFLLGCIGIHLCAAWVSAYNWEQDSLAVRLTLNDNGLFDVPVTQVATKVNERVQKLKFDSLGVYTLGFELFSLDSLKSLSMVKCGLKTLPPTISQWTQLTELNLPDNLLVQLPVEIGSLSQLSLVNVRGNALRALPDSLFQIRNLYYLDIGHNMISSLPTRIRDLSNLTYLYADQDSLTSLPESIALLPFLKELNVSGNQLSSVPYTIAAMTALEKLDVSINVLSTLPDEWSLLSNLTVLDISSNHLCGLSASLTLWADSKQPGWLLSQFCGPDGQGAFVRHALIGRHQIQSCGDGLWIDAEWVASKSALSLLNARGQTLQSPAISQRSMQGRSGWLVEKGRRPSAGHFLKMTTPVGERIIPMPR